METKICASCHTEKPIECFSRDKNEKDGLKRYCKDCISIKSRNYREAHKGEVNARKRISYHKSKERAEERTEKQRKAGTRVCSVCGEEKPLSEFYLCGNGGFRSYCKLCANSTAKIYHETHRDEIIEKKREYNRDHKDDIDAYNREYYQNHSDEIKMRVQEWIEGNKGQHRENAAISAERRRSRAHGLRVSFSRKDWQACKSFFSVNGQLCCAYCGRPLDNAAQDHLIPVAAGGEYVPDNILPVCPSCNSSKQNHEFQDWYHRQSFYSPEREARIFEYCRMAGQYREGCESDSLCNA